MIKVDVFIPNPDGHDARSAERLQEAMFPAEPPVGPYLVTAPEDIVLKKLVWFREGNELSERQWRDVVGVLQITGPGMDRGYLEAWSRRLGVADLLRRADGEAEI